MTIDESLKWMESCAGCIDEECVFGGDVPLNCGQFCPNYDPKYIVGEEEENEDVSSIEIYVPASEVWSFYLQNNDRCMEEMILIAENTSTGYAVYITDQDGFPFFSVCKGDDYPEHDEYAINDEDCEKTAKKLFLRYLVPVSVINGMEVIQGKLPDGLADEDEDEELSRQDMEDAMYERDDELDLAMKDFLAVVLQEPDTERLVANYHQSFIDEALDEILQLLAKEYCCEIYRPVFIEDPDTGCEVYTEYPYDEDAYTTDKDGDQDA